MAEAGSLVTRDRSRSGRARTKTSGPHSTPSSAFRLPGVILKARRCYFARPVPQDEYESICQAARIPPIEAGYGFLMCEDEDGNHVTLITEDVADQTALADSWGGLVAPDDDWEYEWPDSTYRIRRAGWPQEWPGMQEEPVPSP
jgi:hypothetical protein